jgi:hypothetical protein
MMGLLSTVFNPLQLSTCCFGLFFIFMQSACSHSTSLSPDRHQNAVVDNNGSRDTEKRAVANIAQSDDEYLRTATTNDSVDSEQRTEPNSTYSAPVDDSDSVSTDVSEVIGSASSENSDGDAAKTDSMDCGIQGTIDDYWYPVVKGTSKIQLYSFEKFETYYNFLIAERYHGNLEKFYTSYDYRTISKPRHQAYRESQDADKVLLGITMRHKNPKKVVVEIENVIVAFDRIEIFIKVRPHLQYCIDEWEIRPSFSLWMNPSCLSRELKFYVNGIAKKFDHLEF